MKKCVTLQRFNKHIIVLQIKKAKKMKKLVFMFVAMAAISFASCTGNKTNEAANIDTTAVDTAQVDTAQVDTAATATDTATVAE